MKSLQLFLCVFLLLQSCANHGQLTFIEKLPKKLNENSGIVHYRDSTVWLIEDGGNTDNIFKVNFQGKLIKAFEVKKAKNHDWEDLTKDKKGNLYIGDFGNNQNDRKNLTIYKLPNPEKENGTKIDAEKIRFKYPNQKSFPPTKSKLLFDAEAFFHYNKHLYIFTKNRSKPFTGESFIYKIPDSIGTYTAEFLSTLKIGTNSNTSQITSADISPDGKKIVLLGYGKLWVISNFKNDDFANGTIQEIDLGLRTQLESICFKNNNTLLLSDERNPGSGRNLYSYELPQ